MDMPTKISWDQNVWTMMSTQILDIVKTPICDRHPRCRFSSINILKKKRIFSISLGTGNYLQFLKFTPYFRNKWNNIGSISCLECLTQNDRSCLEIN